MSKESKEQPGKIYNEVYHQSIEDPEDFWGEAAESLHWYKKWDKVLDDSKPPFFRWFVGGKTNVCYNAVDRHALGNARGKAALIWESAEQGKSKVITYYELYREVNKFAGALKNLGVKKGDRVVIYLPMVPETIIAMLACARIGAIHAGVFAGFNAEPLAYRIADTGAKVLITADGSLRRGKVVPLKEVVDESLEKAPVEAVIVLDRDLININMKQGRDYYWSDLTEKKGEQYIEPAQLESTDPLWILYTSGTTGKPKGVVRDTGGSMVVIHNSMRQVFDANEGDVFWTTGDIGWGLAHTYCAYGPLLAGIPSVMFEGTPDYPDAGVMWSIVEKYGVSIMVSAPTTLRMLHKFGDKYIREHDTTTLRYIFFGGESLDKATWQWATDVLKVKVIDHYWTTESGWPMISNMPGVESLPIKPGSPTKAVVGYQLAIVDEKGKPVLPNTKGYLVVKPPLPPGTLLTLWGDDDWYRKTYWEQFPGEMLYSTGDYAIEDEDGYLTLLGRADEVINVAGHRIGTRELEEVVLSHPAIAEASVVGVNDAIKGEEPICLAVLKAGSKLTDDLKAEIRQLIRERIGAIATPRDIRFVHVLPKTRSGKYMRRVLKAVYEGQSLDDLSTIEDGASVDEVKEAIMEMKKELA
jgi:propionyl-CoA synthetase